MNVNEYKFNYKFYSNLKCQKCNLDIIYENNVRSVTCPLCKSDTYFTYDENGNPSREFYASDDTFHCPECGEPSNGICINNHQYEHDELLKFEPEYITSDGIQKYIGSIQYCPQCKKNRKTSCTACGCGICYSCKYRFVCRQ